MILQNVMKTGLEVFQLTGNRVRFIFSDCTISRSELLAGLLGISNERSHSPVFKLVTNRFRDDKKSALCHTNQS